MINVDYSISEILHNANHHDDPHDKMISATFDLKALGG